MPLVQSSGARSGNGTSQAWTWATAPTVGNVIIVKAVGWANPTGPTASCADAASNSYTQRTNALSTGSGATTTRGAIFDCVIASSPSSTTITWSISADHSVVFEEWSGLDTASLSDQVATPALSGLISGSGAQTLTVGPTATLAQADELVQTLLGAATGLAASNIATPSGYTGGVFEQNSPSFVGMGSAYKTVAATTAVDATWPFDVAGGAGQTAVALLATYRLASAPPTITSQPSDQTEFNGGSVTFSSSATSSVGSLTWAWQDNSGGSFANISTGSGSPSSLSVGPVALAMNGRRYRIQWTDSNGTSTSSEATLFVRSQIGDTRLINRRKVRAVGSRWTWAGYANEKLTQRGWLSRDIVLPISAASGTHTTTGALSAQAATISGAAQHQHAATGALSAQAATVAGSAAHLTLHTTTGALSAQSATIAGSAAHQHATTGALQAQSATIAGSATHTAAGASHSTSGALTADAATVSGSATHLTLHTTTGALGAQSATISGAAVHPHTTSGALQAQSATLAGTAAHATLHTTGGALSAQAATLSGAAAHEHASAGALAAQSATIAGTAVHAAAGVHIATGALQAGDASISGSAAAPIQRQVLGGWAKYRRQDRQERPDDEESTKTPQPNDTPVVEAVAPKQRIRGRIRIADIAARLAEQQQADADKLERQAVERARRKRRQQQEEELLLF